MLWVRLGDGDNYNPFDDLSDVAAYLSENGVEQVERHTRYGVRSAAFKGNNYISLYWGDNHAQPSRDVTAGEIAELNSELRKVHA